MTDRITKSTRLGEDTVYEDTTYKEDTRTETVGNRAYTVGKLTWAAGNILGHVAGGNPVSFKEVADDLHCSWSSVRRSVDWLVGSHGLIRKRSGKGDMYSYFVPDSIKQFELREEPEFLDEETGFDIENAPDELA